MMSTTLKIIGIALFYFITIGTGIVMHKKGRPFNTLLSALHKVIALAVVVVSILLVRSGMIHEIPSTFTIFLLVLTLIFLVSLFITGAMLSDEKEGPKLTLLLHNIATVLAPVSGIICLVLIFRS